MKSHKYTWIGYCISTGMDTIARHASRSACTVRSDASLAIQAIHVASARNVTYDETCLPRESSFRILRRVPRRVTRDTSVSRETRLSTAGHVRYFLEIDGYRLSSACRAVDVRVPRDTSCLARHGGRRFCTANITAHSTVCIALLHLFLFNSKLT